MLRAQPLGLTKNYWGNFTCCDGSNRSIWRSKITCDDCHNSAPHDVSAVSVASILHYGVAAILQSEGYSFGAAGEFQVIAEKRDFGRAKPTTIASIKTAMAAEGVDVRLAAVAE